MWASWERFRMELLWGGRIALRSQTGHYLCAIGGGGRECVANRMQRGPWETFGVVLWEGVGHGLVNDIFKVFRGKRLLYRLDSDRPVWVKPESGSNSVVLSTPDKPFEGNFDGIKVGTKVYKLIDNCDDVVLRGSKMTIYCGNFRLNTIGKRLEVDFKNLELPNTDLLMEVAQEIVGGELKEQPVDKDGNKDVAWTPIFEADPVGLAYDIRADVSRRQYKDRDRKRDFDDIDQNQYEQWEREDREWVERTA
ncbi:MAG: hypothetical protein OXT67_05825 [Zetaproteobacteria bacterium]|nr:hypothetical protein [Zetaproteobacteria bacterium]